MKGVFNSNKQKARRRRAGIGFKFRNKHIIYIAASLMFAFNLLAIKILSQISSRREFESGTSAEKIIPGLKAEKGWRKQTCALLFFGLPKFFRRKALPSIRSNIIKHNPNCDIYLHTYNIDVLPRNERNYEPRAKMNVREVFDLTPNVILDSEENFEHSRNLTYYRQFFPYAKKSWVYPQSLDNMVKQWHSIDGVWKLMDNSQKSRYDRVGLFRSDLIYDNPINILQEGDAVSPNFGLVNNTRELNDRFFFGTYEHAKKWADRFSPVPAYMESSVGKEFGLHSETYLYYVMRDVSITSAPFCARRVRVTGRAEHDCWCDEKSRPKVCSWWLDYLKKHHIKFPNNWEFGDNVNGNIS